MFQLKKTVLLNQHNVNSKIRDVMAFRTKCDGKTIVVESDYFRASIDYYSAYNVSYFGQLINDHGSYEETILSRIISLLYRKTKTEYILDGKDKNYYAVDSMHVKQRLRESLSRLDESIEDLLNQNVIALDYIIDKCTIGDEFVVMGFSYLHIFCTELVHGVIHASNPVLSFSGITANEQVDEMITSIKEQKGSTLVSRFLVADSSIHIDENVVNFLINNRFLLLSITDELCNSNIFADDISFNEILNRPLILKQKCAEIANSSEFLNSNLHDLRVRSSCLITSINQLYEYIFGEYPMLNIDLDSRFKVSTNQLGIPKIIGQRELLLLFHVAAQVERDSDALYFHVLSHRIKVDISRHLYLLTLPMDDLKRQMKQFIDLHKAVLAILSGALKIEDDSCSVNILKLFKYVKGIV